MSGQRPLRPRHRSKSSSRRQRLREPPNLSMEQCASVYGQPPNPNMFPRGPPPNPNMFPRGPPPNPNMFHRGPPPNPNMFHRGPPPNPNMFNRGPPPNPNMFHRGPPPNPNMFPRGPPPHFNTNACPPAEQLPQQQPRLHRSSSTVSHSSVESRDDDCQVVETDRSGTVLSYDKAFGFIAVDDEPNRRLYNDNVFVHQSNLRMTSLDKGDKVLFDVARGRKKGFQAINVHFNDPLSTQAVDAHSDLSATRIDRRGEVKKYHASRGFGVVQCFLTKKTFLAHRTDFKPPLVKLAVGQVVKFDIAPDPKGRPSAHNVEVIAEAPEAPEHGKRGRQRTTSQRGSRKRSESPRITRLASESDNSADSSSEEDPRSPSPSNTTSSDEDNDYSTAASGTSTSMRSDSRVGRLGEVMFTSDMYTNVLCQDPRESIFPCRCELKPPLQRLVVGQQIKFDDEKTKEGRRILRNVELVIAEGPLNAPEATPAANDATVGATHRPKKDMTLVVSEEFECCICYELLATNSVQTPCEHYFCRECIEQWLEMNDNCPMCNTSIAKDQLEVIPRLIRNLIEGMRIAETAD